MKLYIISIMAYNGATVRHGGRLITGTSKAEAIGLGYEVINAKAPQPEGWRDHNVTAELVTPDQLKNIVIVLDSEYKEALSGVV